ncbi:hypothetical protein P3735_22160 [Vibrio parahaemolyticus]|nr:hypothetical protein [Vibrio parahaemolyticus]
MMVLPKNTAKENADKDLGLLTPQQVEDALAGASKNHQITESLFKAKTPADYKKLIDENTDNDQLLKLLDESGQKLGILLSVRINTANYMKLKRLLRSSDNDLREFLEALIEREYTK